MKERRQLNGLTEEDIVDMVNRCEGEISVLIIPADMNLTDLANAGEHSHEEEIAHGK